MSTRVRPPAHSIHTRPRRVVQYGPPPHVRRVGCCTPTDSQPNRVATSIHPRSELILREDSDNEEEAPAANVSAAGAGDAAPKPAEVRGTNMTFAPPISPGGEVFRGFHVALWSFNLFYTITMQ